MARASELAQGRVELSAPHPHIELSRLQGMLAGWRQDGIRLTMHNYFPPPEEDFVLNTAASCARTREQCEQLLDGVRALAGASQSPVYGIHAGYLSDVQAPAASQKFEFGGDRVGYEEAETRAVAFMSERALQFERQRIRLLVENLFPFPDDDHSLCCAPDQIARFLSQVPESVGLLLDLGHLNIAATLMGFDRDDGLDQLLARFGHRLFQVHLSHNDGTRDEHLAVMDGNWQLDALTRVQATDLGEGQERLFCLEARNSSVADIEASLRAVNGVLGA